MLQIPPFKDKIQTAQGVLQESATLHDIQREHILQILRTTGWVIGGRYGAAAKLGLPRTTLISKMKRLEIAHERKTPSGRTVRQEVDPAPCFE